MSKPLQSAFFSQKEGLPHFPCYPDHLVTEDALGTRICWPRWSDNADFNRYWRPSACFRQAARKVRQTPFDGFFGPKFHILTPKWLPTMVPLLVILGVQVFERD